jgi:hypothetical protein
MLLVFDIVAFWAWKLRPLASVDGVEIAVWSVLGGTAGVAGIRWALLDQPRMRFLAASSIALMVAFSTLHPWHNGYAVDAELPVAKERSREIPPGTVVKYEDGPLTEGEEAQY